MRNWARAYWPTRILPAVGILATLFAVGFALLIATQVSRGPHTMGGPLDILGLPFNVVVAFAFAGIAVIGLVWMLRIFRGPRDEPPRWRYRD